MSGPKVVRIVTREEVEAICRRYLAAVQAATDEFRRKAQRLGFLNEALEQSLVVRNQRFASMLAAGKYREIQKKAPEAVAFLASEGKRLHEQFVAVQAEARSRTRRVYEAARTVVAALEAAGVEVPTRLREAASANVSLDEETARRVQKDLANALKRLPGKKAGNERATEIQDLARRLAEGEETRSFEDWVASQNFLPTASEQRLDLLLAELTSMQDPAAQNFMERALEISREADPSRRVLLTDSLVLDVAAHVTRLKTAEDLRHRMRQAMAAIETFTSTKARSLCARIQTEMNEPTDQGASTLIAEAERLAEEEIRLIAAASRRRAVLTGLASLGYEVRENIEAVWVQEGRIVVRKPSSPDYGVELGAPADASRLQIRLVGSDRPSTPRNARRDADQEAIWCSAFDQLKALVETGGGKLILEKAIEPGAQPVKTTSLPDFVSAQTEAAREEPKLRTLQR
jgi:hypothetical protein